MGSDAERDYQEQKREWLERQIQKITRIANRNEPKDKDKEDGRQERNN